MKKKIIILMLGLCTLLLNVSNLIAQENSTVAVQDKSEEEIEQLFLEKWEIQMKAYRKQLEKLSLNERELQERLKEFEEQKELFYEKQMVSRQKAEIMRQQAEINKQQAEITRKEAEVKRQEAEIKKQKAAVKKLEQVEAMKRYHDLTYDADTFWEMWPNAKYSFNKDARVLLEKTLDLQDNSQTVEYEVEIKNKSQLYLNAYCAVSLGKVKMEIFDPSGNKLGFISVERSIRPKGRSDEDNETANGSIVKTINEPELGKWRVVLSPKKSKTKIHIVIAQDR
jgi:hypothetical protein